MRVYWETSAKYRKYRREYFREYQKKASVRRYKNKWAKENYLCRPDIKRRNNNRAKKLRKTNPLYALRQNIGRRIRWAIKTKKEKSSPHYLGCTIFRYKKYLESRFTARMTWANYGTYWVIDHIRPCISFNLKMESERKKCFGYKNTQPMTRRRNCIKGSRYTEDN